jgi:hypothetical protein
MCFICGTLPNGISSFAFRTFDRVPTVDKRLARHFTFWRSRVLTPVPPDQVWIFFRSFPTSHRGISHITDKVNAGSVSTFKYLPSSFRIHPYRTHPEFSQVSVAENALESLSSPPPFGGSARSCFNLKTSRCKM